MTRQERLPVVILATCPQTVLVDIRAEIARRGTVDIVRPVLDLCRTLHAFFISLAGERSEPPREEPLKHQSHDEANGDDSNDENE